jgi:hypothetical protein
MRLSAESRYASYPLKTAKNRIFLAEKPYAA